MIKNPEKLKEFERNLKRNSGVDINKNFEIFEALYKEVIDLPKKKPLEDKETVVKIAKIVNSV